MAHTRHESPDGFTLKDIKNLPPNFRGVASPVIDIASGKKEGGSGSGIEMSSSNGGSGLIVDSLESTSNNNKNYTNTTYGDLAATGAYYIGTDADGVAAKLRNRISPPCDNSFKDVSRLNGWLCGSCSFVNSSDDLSRCQACQKDRACIDQDSNSPTKKGQQSSPFAQSLPNDFMCSPSYHKQDVVTPSPKVGSNLRTSGNMINELGSSYDTPCTELPEQREVDNTSFFPLETDDILEALRQPLQTFLDATDDPPQTLHMPLQPAAAKKDEVKQATPATQTEDSKPISLDDVGVPPVTLHKPLEPVKIRSSDSILDLPGVQSAVNKAKEAIKLESAFQEKRLDEKRVDMDKMSRTDEGNLLVESTTTHPLGISNPSLPIHHHLLNRSNPKGIPHSANLLRGFSDGDSVFNSHSLEKQHHHPLNSSKDRLSTLSATHHTSFSASMNDLSSWLSPNPYANIKSHSEWASNSSGCIITATKPSIPHTALKTVHSESPISNVGTNIDSNNNNNNNQVPIDTVNRTSPGAERKKMLQQTQSQPSLLEWKGTASALIDRSEASSLHNDAVISDPVVTNGNRRTSVPEFLLPNYTPSEGLKSVAALDRHHHMSPRNHSLSRSNEAIPCLPNTAWPIPTINQNEEQVTQQQVSSPAASEQPKKIEPVLSEWAKQQQLPEFQREWKPTIKRVVTSETSIANNQQSAGGNISSPLYSNLANSSPTTFIWPVASPVSISDEVATRQPFPHVRIWQGPRETIL